ncbi:hypothetical protein N0V87_004961 [Didymella glomerata]|uniref:Uncharacterized protein n=1 Tax=Didymella glomerata TaxID=749621 RepID=A0A9W9C098_9PLEO|nr:hypothetical protein N0V87_004961 [Didymella glomerata]
MSDIDMTDSREHGWDESDESQINDELERRHYNCVDDFEAKDLTLPLLPDDVQLPSYFAMYNEGIDKHRPKPDEDSFYVSKYQIFNGIFKVEGDADPGAGVGMATLCDMLEYSVIEGAN